MNACICHRLSFRFAVSAPLDPRDRGGFRARPPLDGQGRAYSGFTPGNQVSLPSFFRDPHRVGPFHSQNFYDNI